MGLRLKRYIASRLLGRGHTRRVGA
jgi:hypothetical protein